jgi:hypothetical protein
MGAIMRSFAASQNDRHLAMMATIYVRTAVGAVRDVGVAGSNPVTPTINFIGVFFHSAGRGSS